MAMRRRALLALAAAAALAPGLAAASEAAEKKKGGGLSYIQIPVITATLVRPGGRRGVLTVETGVDVPDARLHDYADKVLPRLRAAYFQTLQIYAQGLAPGQEPDADYLARQLQRDTDRILGKPGARLLLGTMLMN
jgi:hypothetical protein